MKWDWTLQCGVFKIGQPVSRQETTNRLCGAMTHHFVPKLRRSSYSRYHVLVIHVCTTILVSMSAAGNLINVEFIAERQERL